ncbi:hypothetical protein N0M98_19360 [Paenibacillus doosanensis]|uniref:Copper amine oxidase-like N-terminal domain-containing protein n=1 Tax=Paenibacillus konkukensis TaxID=2020716 RepID=A0ABY4RFK4_9BACL|nr:MULTISPECIES: hypothetical protein [Paenibacillus]MCS7462303.1 hypothetical protein [Paenibacillus doosanensis]UQZ80885.1 hypothetical protein SK3146_00041 [Paenibacillus konkukensis]
MKRWLSAWLVCMMLLPLFPANSHAAAGEVQVRIAAFPIQVNGQLINNRQSEYPFLVYNDVTYVPLNWDTVQELELRLDWSPEEGLQLYRSCCTNREWEISALDKAPYKPVLTASNALNRSYTANVSTYPIQVYGQQVNNAEAPYPFLEFRNITYLPLTWDYAHRRLMMDLQWSAEGGLAVWSGQDQVLGQIRYDDDEALYIDAQAAEDSPLAMVKVAKSMSEAPVWLSPEQADAIRRQAEEAAGQRSRGGKEVPVERDGDMLAYQGMPLAKLRDTETGELGGTQLEAKGYLYEIDDKRRLLGVYTYYPIAKIGPAPGARYQLFSIINGKASAIEQFPFLPELVSLNPDGTVWIARDRLPFRDLYYAGSGLLALMDREGEVRVANDVWNEQDVSPLGLDSPSAEPVDGSGKLLVRLYGKPLNTEQEAAMRNGNYPVDPTSGRHPLELPAAAGETDGLYEAGADFTLKKLSAAPDSSDDLHMYKDKQGDLYTIGRYSNALTNWSRNEQRTWTDLELLQSTTK